MDTAISYTVTSQQNCSGGLVKNGAAFISLIPQHPGRGIQSVRGIQAVVGQGGERREIKWPPRAWAVNHLEEEKYFRWSWRSCLDRLQMSLFCCKLPQLPSGTGRSELAGLSTPRKGAAATAEGNLMTQITDGRTEGQRLLYPLRTGHFYLFPHRECMWCSHLHSQCHRHTF